MSDELPEEIRKRLAEAQLPLDEESVRLFWRLHGTDSTLRMLPVLIQHFRAQRR